MSKTIIVTGAASAYGRAIIHTLADEGHGVVAIIDPINENNMTAARELQQTDNVELVEVDVKNDESVKSGFSSILKRYGHVDVLINNETPVRLELPETSGVEYYQEVYNFNVCGALRIFQAILPTMRKNKGGLLINVNTGINYLAIPFVTALAIAKAGLEILTEGILREVKRYGIESVSLWTGYYPPELRKDGVAAFEEQKGQDMPLGKIKLEAELSEKNKNARQHVQAVAVLISELVNMPAGKRPARFCLNPELERAEVQFAEVRKLASQAWHETYGVIS
jgi:NAD(P)-dependent dehydrogenase (short-subunit alcohol dehydrogenase family)